MTPFRQITIVTLFLNLLLAQMPAFAVDDYYQQQLQNERLLERQQRQQVKQRENARYRSQVGDKALNGVANIFTGPLELPKNIINQVNYNYSTDYTNGFGDNPDDNIVYGVIGGVISGALNATGRIMTGVTDLVTAPLPTKPIIQPRYVWDDFDKKNTYGQVFRLVDNPKIEPYVAPAPRPVAAISPVQDQTEQYSQQTNQNLDTMFRKEMQK
jgi:putative exosortase-associated protein (TIGR04073 family)